MEVSPDHSGLVLHEAGFLPHNDWWDFPNVLSLFWRLCYNDRKGHKVVFAGREIEWRPSGLSKSTTLRRSRFHGSRGSSSRQSTEARPTDMDDLDNPFPPSYGEDFLRELQKANTPYSLIARDLRTT